MILLLLRALCASTVTILSSEVQKGVGLYEFALVWRVIQEAGSEWK